MEKQTLKEIVDEVLKTDKRAREDTNWLIIKTFQKYGVKMFIDYRDLKKLPSAESILKTRRDILHKENKYNGDFVPEEGITYETKQQREVPMELSQTQ